VWALGELGLPAAAPLIAARIEDPDPGARREAAATLRLFKEADPKDGPIVRALRKAFADPDQRTRLFAVQTATKLELRAPAFIERLHDPDDEVQFAALLAVAKFRAREAEPHIVPLLKVVNARVKRHDALCWSPSAFNPVACTAATTLRDFGDAAGLTEAKKLVPHCLEPARSPSGR
jgi:HEAT repeat protein